MKKALVIFEISTLEFVKVKENHAERKKLWHKILYHLGTFRLEFEKAIAKFEISTLQFFKMQSFVQK